MARVFNGTTDFLRSATTPVTATPISVSIWFYHTGSTGNDDCLVQIQDTSEPSHYFRLGKDSSGNFLRVQTNSGFGGVTALGTDTFTVSTWQHALGVWASPTSRKIYTNGTNEIENTTSRTPTNIDTVDIGREGDDSPDDHWPGRLGECVIWNAGLVANEARALESGVSPLSIRRSSIVGYWPIYGLSSPEPDFSGSQRDMVLNGTPALANHAPVIPYSARFWGHGHPVEAAAAVAHLPQDEAHRPHHQPIMAH